MSRYSCMGRVFCALVLQGAFPSWKWFPPGGRRAPGPIPCFIPCWRCWGAAEPHGRGESLCSWGRNHPRFVSEAHFSLCKAHHDQTLHLLPCFRNESLAVLVIGTELSGFETLFQHLSTICRAFFLIGCMTATFLFEVELLKIACH